MNKTTAYEPQNQIQFDNYYDKGGVVLGPYSSHIYRSDPRHICFLLARYKFCSKILDGKNEILEIGCGDSFGTPLVLQNVKSVHCIDIEPLVIEDNLKRTEYGDRCTFEVHDITSEPLDRQFDGAFALDVIEHIPAAAEQRFMSNIHAVLRPHGICIIGTPNITAKEYGTPGSKEGHINLKDHKSLRELMSGHFHNVLIFSMNDEVVHTGFYPMAHYLIGVGIGPKQRKS